MQAKETTFQALIEGSKQFVVPLYQRTYSWKEPQLERLWSDVLEQTELTAEGVSDGSHFIGSIVLAPSPELGAVGIQRWVIVDGQQRLTTLMLLLCALRDHLAASEPIAREKFNDLYLINKWEEGQRQLRLLPTQDDRASFAACVYSTPDAGGSDAVGSAYRFFRRALVAAGDPADPHDLSLIEGVVARNLVVVGITASRDDNVYRIFESLNNTGLQLSQADLIRNYLFMCLPTKGEAAYVQHWLPMQQLLDGGQLELLMYLDLVLRGDERVRRDDLYSSHQERIRQLAGDEDAVLGYLAELQGRSRLLRLIVASGEEKDERVRAGVERLNRWGALVAYPALMSLLEARSAGRATSDELAEAVSYVESFLVRRMLAGIPSNNLNRIFQTLVGELQTAEGDLPAVTRRVLSGTRMYWPTDDELRDAIRGRNFYWSGRQSQRMFVLRRLEESYPSKERADLYAPELTIEHVMPQTLTEGWLAAVAEDAEPDDDPADLAQRLLHTLGNLTLSGYNEKLSNSEFAVKRHQLGQSNLELNRPIASEERWGPRQILARADDLAVRAAGIWPGPDESVRGATAPRRWESLHQALAALPPGAWTSYADLAELIGSHPVPVASHVASDPSCPNGHRVLTSAGRVADGFHWTDPNDQRDPVAVLREEGVRFDEGLQADPGQRFSPHELASLIGLEEEPAQNGLPTSAPELDPAALSERHESFFQQLADSNGPAAAGAVTRLLEHWVGLGGYLNFGTSKITSCFLMATIPSGTIWPLAIYPGSTIEVVFQWLRVRPPFDDVALRAEFRNRLNAAPGIEIPSSKLDLRPSFPVGELVDPETWRVVADALTWFVSVVEASKEAVDEAAPRSDAQ